MNSATIQSPPEKFSPKWWNSFHQQTGRMTIPSVIDNVFNNDVLALREGVYEMLQNLKNEEDLFWRVWVDGKQKEKYKEQIIEDPIQCEDDLILWQKRNFGDKKFGIILNRGERYSNKAREKILSYLAPLFVDKTPFGGIHFTIFIGNYGWTPIGIHQDHPGSFVNHFHLGPGDKTMYMWEENNYKNILGGKDNDEHRAEQLVPFADYTCQFKAGDIFFMPWNYYHIGNAEELSIGLTVWFNYTTVNGLLNGVWESAFSDLFTPNKEQYSLVQNIKTREEDQSIDFLWNSLDQNALSDSIEITLKDQLDNYTNASISNSWFDNPQPKKKKKDSHLEYADSIQLDSSEIIYKYHNHKISIFHKGNKLSILHHQDITTILQEINSRKILPIHLLLSNRFKDWPEGAGIRVLEILQENNIIRRTA